MKQFLSVFILALCVFISNGAIGNPPRIHGFEISLNYCDFWKHYECYEWPSLEEMGIPKPKAPGGLVGPSEPKMQDIYRITDGDNRYKLGKTCYYNHPTCRGLECNGKIEIQNEAASYRDALYNTNFSPISDWNEEFFWDKDRKYIDPIDFSGRGNLFNNAYYARCYTDSSANPEKDFLAIYSRKIDGDHEDYTLVAQATGFVGGAETSETVIRGTAVLRPGHPKYYGRYVDEYRGTNSEYYHYYTVGHVCAPSEEFPSNCAYFSSDLLPDHQAKLILKYEKSTDNWATVAQKDIALASADYNEFTTYGLVAEGIPEYHAVRFELYLKNASDHNWLIELNAFRLFGAQCYETGEGIGQCMK